MSRLLHAAILAGALLPVACAPAATPQAPSTQPAQPAAQSAQPSLPQPAPAQASKPQVDADVQQTYDQFVKKEMPKVPLELLQAAKRDGTVTYYHTLNPAPPELVKEFQRIFPFVKVQVLQLNGGPLVEKFFAESHAGQFLADVVLFSSLSEAKKAHKENLVMQYKVTVEDELPKEQGVPGYVVPVAGSLQLVTYNSERIKDEEAKVLRKWEGLLDPRWDNKRFTLGEVMAGGTTHLANFYFYKTFGTKMWERIAKTQYAVFPGINPQLAAVVAGERDIAAHGPSGNIIAQWERGAPIHWHYAEPHLSLPYPQFISAKAPHPSAAKLFQEFSMSIPGQQIVVGTGNFSYRKGPKDTAKYTSEPWYVPPDPAKVWDYSDDELATTLPEITKQWRAILK